MQNYSQTNVTHIFSVYIFIRRIRLYFICDERIPVDFG